MPSRASRVGAAVADEGLEPRPCFLLGDDAAQAVCSIGAMLDGQERLQL